jgi:hypothetical protein
MLYERDCFVDLGIDGRIIPKWILKEDVGEGVVWINLTQSRENWWTVMKSNASLGPIKCSRFLD